MGYASWMCAKSGQSIPAPATESTECTLFLRDGSTHSGIYNGYARLVTPGTGYGSIDEVMRMVGERAGLKTPDNKSYFDWPQALQESIREAFIKQYPDVTPYDVMTGKSVSILALVGNDPVKIVKSKYVTADDSWENLPESPYCPFQGHFYQYPGQHNDPPYPAPKAAKARGPR